MLKTTLLSFVLLGTLFADGPVVKTGQTTVYKVNDDGTYQTGIVRSYTRNANGVVKDNATGLEWQDDYSDNGGNIKFVNWSDAISYCDNLVLDGKSDWRLPSIEELVSIIDKGRVNPSIDPTFHVTSSVYWSSATYASGSSFAWFVHFGSGSDYWGTKVNIIYVRCVRSGQ